MNCDIKQVFSAKDLAVGDLMYDVKNDVMVEVAFINDANDMEIENVIKKIPVKQFVMKDTVSGILFIITSLGDKWELERLHTGQPRFRHLMKFTEPDIINWGPFQIYPINPYWNPGYPEPNPYWYYDNTPVYCGGSDGTSVGDGRYGTVTANEFDISSISSDSDTTDYATNDPGICTYTITIEDLK